MITIKYHRVLARTTRIDGAKSWTQAAYAIGDKPPNYPMPAIPLIVHRGKYGIYILDALYPSNRDYRVIRYK